MALDDVLMEAEEHMEKAIEHLRHEFRGIRTGRASPALVEYLKIDYYGTPTDLKNIAAISVPEAMQLLIKPFSPSDTKAIEKAISESQLNLTPHSDGKQVRLQLPPMSQDVRNKMAVSVKQHAEQAKVAIRNVRRDANKGVDQLKKDGELTEDEVDKAHDQVQELLKQYETKIEELTEAKRAEVMEV